MSKWGKVAKTLGEKGEEEDMEEEEEVPIYTIETAPDPKFRFKMMRPQAYFEGRRADFQDTSTETRDEMMPDPETRRKEGASLRGHDARANTRVAPFVRPARASTRRGASRRFRGLTSGSCPKRARAGGGGPRPRGASIASERRTRQWHRRSSRHRICHFRAGHIRRGRTDDRRGSM